MRVPFSFGTDSTLHYEVSWAKAGRAAPVGRQEPSRDLFEFSGTLKATVLTGTLKRSDLRQPSRPGSRERVQLKIQPQAAMLPAGSYAEWTRKADEILKRRGPKW
jgi:hypothetical protein